MKRNDIKQLASKSASELQTQLTEAMAQLAKLRLTKHTGRLTNPTQLRHLRDDIARLKGSLRRAELTEVKA